MKLKLRIRASLASAAFVVACSVITSANAFDFNTIVFFDDFEGFDDGHTVSDGANEAPSTGTGLLWQYIGTAGQQVEVTTAQAFGEGTKSLDYVRPFTGITPRYFTYPALVPEADVTANTEFGIQYDVYLTQNEFAVGQGAPYEGLSGFNNGIAPGSGPLSAGSLVTYGDGELRMWDSVEGMYILTGQFLGEGWQTIETSYAVGEDLGGIADTLVTLYLTRHDGNSAGALERTQVYQSTESLPLGVNWRADFFNSGRSRYYLDNVTLGTIGESIGELAGDYNNNGVVDAADYTVWRDNLGTQNELPNDPIGATIGQAQYDQWKANFGAEAGAASSFAATSIPEPSTIVLLTVIASIVLLRVRRVTKY